MGTGKTYISLMVLRYLQHCGEVKNCLVLVPNRINLDGWKEEVEKHYRGPSKLYVVRGNIAEAKALLAESPTDLLVITTYQGLLHLTTKSVPAKEKTRHVLKNRWIVDPAACRKLSKLFQLVILDESTTVKNYDSLFFKVCKAVTAKQSFVLLMTGTPHGRDLHDLWSQYYLVDRGETLGRFLAVFRQAFYEEKASRWSPWRREYTLRKDRKPLLTGRLYNRAIRYSAEECSDLPESVEIVRHLDLPPESLVYYKSVISEAIKARQHRELRNNFIKMRQIASGFMTLKHGAPGMEESTILRLPANPKLEELCNIVQFTGDSPIVVFVAFVWSAKQIIKELHEQKVSVSGIFGSTTYGGGVESFKRGKTRVFVATAGAAALGANLQIAPYMVFYESPVSPIVRDQAICRIRRFGQKSRKVFYYDLVVKGTIEGKILTYLKAGRDLRAEILGGRATFSSLFSLDSPTE
jgi:SNF2 family DNA or RNA helicase